MFKHKLENTLHNKPFLNTLKPKSQFNNVDSTFTNIYKLILVWFIISMFSSMIIHDMLAIEFSITYLALVRSSIIMFFLHMPTNS